MRGGGRGVASWGGKGNALRTGFHHAIEKGYRYAITIDSDGQHFPADMPDFLDWIRKDPDSLIIGARNKEQLTDHIKTTDWEMTTKEVAGLDELSRPPKVYPYWMLERMSIDR